MLGDNAKQYATALYHYRNLPEVAEFQEWTPETVTEVEILIAGQGTSFLKLPGQFYQWGIFLKHEQASLIGDFGVSCKPDQAGLVEFGIALDPAYQHQGYATEALWHLLDYLFRKQGIYRVIASVDPDNQASMQLMQRVGFRQEAHHIRSYPFRGRMADDIVFALLAEEWPPSPWEGQV
ncbi:MAG: GNAT family N-acetyltransferase [Proteobacteria bacterium]|nr:GNAT family N-acetyltransferase [Pseudomonadota bacterium]